MPDGDWNKVVGFVGAIVAALVMTSATIALIWQVAVSHTKSELEAKPHATYYAEQTARQIKERCTAINPVSRDMCIEEIVKASHENQRNEADLSAQRQMANWAFAMAVVSCYGLVLTVAGIWFVRENLGELQKARQVSLQALDAAMEGNKHTFTFMKSDLRPWIKFYEINNKITVNKEGIAVEFRCRVFNCGKSPARSVFVQSSILFSDTVVTPWNYLREFAEKMRDISADYENTVFPGDTDRQKVSCKVWAEVWNPRYIYIVVSVAYRFGEFKDFYKTCRLYQISTIAQYHKRLLPVTLDFKAPVFPHLAVEQAHTGDYAT
jgi:hypothetical protein